MIKDLEVEGLSRVIWMSPVQSQGSILEGSSRVRVSGSRRCDKGSRGGSEGSKGPQVKGCRGNLAA